MNEGTSIAEALVQLQQVAPEAPFLALGQTVFWDEPMKAGIALASRRLGYSRTFVAGVHDTDYFAKLATGPRQRGKFKTVPHNDTTTRGLWSAAAEFSTLFGSETVVTRERLLQGGLNLRKVLRARPRLLDEATEAWGWRGVVSLEDHPPITAQLPLRPLWSELMETFLWAVDGTLESLSGGAKAQAEDIAEEFRKLVCDAREDDPGLTLGQFYKRLIPEFYRKCANREVPLEATSTTELLRFNRSTCALPRFQLVSHFLDPTTADVARAAYDATVSGTQIYTLDRFGSAAIPFDLVIPGIGRGTLRVARRAVIVMTPTPQFISLKRPVETLEDLAEAVERRFGPECVLIGKAVTLIGMLAREFVFVFHEGASSYVTHSRDLHRRLVSAGMSVPANPILRVRYHAWDALQACCSWIRLPEPFRQAFGSEETCAPSFAARWREVVQQQEELLERLGKLRRPIELIRFLDEVVGGFWNRLAQEYESIEAELLELRARIESVRRRRLECYAQLDRLKREVQEAELKKGLHFRERIFERKPTEEDLAERARLADEAARLHEELYETRLHIRSLMHEQAEVARAPNALEAHERRRRIELEAELKRLRLIRHAVIASEGLVRSARRPSAWWFSLLCPDGLWFRETIESSECYLEPLV